jgi:hypothetical protein
MSSVSGVIVDRLAQGKFGSRRVAAGSGLSEQRIGVN